MTIDYNSIAKLAFDCEMREITFDLSDFESVTIVMFDNKGFEYVFNDIDECENFLLENREHSEEIVNNVFIIDCFAWNEKYNNHLISYTINKMTRNFITKDYLEYENCVIDESVGQFECLDLDNQIACFHLEQKQNTYRKHSELSL